MDILLSCFLSDMTEVRGSKTEMQVGFFTITQYAHREGTLSNDVPQNEFDYGYSQRGDW